MAITATLRPNAQGSHNNWTISGGSAKFSNLADALDGTGCFPSLAFSLESFHMDNIAADRASPVSEVRMRTRIQGNNFTNVYYRMRLNGVESAQTLAGSYTGALAFFEFELVMPRPGGGVWTVGDVNDAEACFEVNWGAATPTCVSLWLFVTYNPVPPLTGSVRDAASRSIVLFRSPSLAEITTPLRYGNRAPLDDLTLTHREYPTVRGAAGSKSWERALLKVLRTKYDIDGRRAILTCLDPRRFYHSLLDTGVTEETLDGAQQGVVRLDRGATRTFTRASKAWVNSPSAAAQGLVQAVELGNDVLGVTYLGTLIEAAATNRLLHSSFVSALTGWTSAGTGSNGSAIAADTADLLYESIVSGNSIRFTAGNPIHVSDLQITSTATASITANTIVCVTADHKDDSASAPLYYALQRGVDSRWWRDSDSTWQVAKTWNAMTGSTTIHRHRSKAIDVGASATTLTLLLGIPNSGGVAGQINRAYHAQIEDGRYPSSRILTTTATVTRAVSDLTISNDHGKRTYDSEHGSATMTWVFNWSLADLAAGAVRVLFDAFWDASNYDRVLYDQASGRLIFRRRLNGTNTDAFIVVSPVAGTLLRVGWRWVGSRGELNLSPYTLSIFADEVKGTDVVAAGTHQSIPATAAVRVGADNTPANYADGCCRQLRVSPYVLEDAEIADAPA